MLSQLPFSVVPDHTPAPVLFLTALDEKDEIIEGLVAGGNDFITKPYDVDELVARVKAQLRLTQMNRVSAGNYRQPIAEKRIGKTGVKTAKLTKSEVSRF